MAKRIAEDGVELEECRPADRERWAHEKPDCPADCECDLCEALFDSNEEDVGLFWQGVSKGVALLAVAGLVAFLIAFAAPVLFPRDSEPTSLSEGVRP